MYFLRPSVEEEHRLLPFGDEIELYAYTLDKKLDKIFLSTRKKECFYRKKGSVTKKQLNDLYKLHKLEQLKIVRSSTKLSNEKMEICITENEETECMNLFNYMVYSKFITITKGNPYIFKKEYIEALKDIGWSKYYDIMSTGECAETIEILPDMITLFAHLYGWCLK